MDGSEKFMIFLVHTIPNHHPLKIHVLPKTVLQIILAATVKCKWQVRHTSTSPKQQRRPLPSVLYLSFFYGFYTQEVICYLLVGLMQDNTEMARELQDIASSAPLDPEEIKVLKARWPKPDFVGWPETPVLDDDLLVHLHCSRDNTNVVYCTYIADNYDLFTSIACSSTNDQDLRTSLTTIGQVFSIICMQYQNWRFI